MRELLLRKAMRLGTGIIVGTFVSSIWHLFILDKTFAAFCTRRLQLPWGGRFFEGFETYSIELEFALAGTTVILAPRLWCFLKKWSRSWVAGICSVLPLATAIPVLLAIQYRGPKWEAAIVGSVMAVLLLASSEVVLSVRKNRAGLTRLPHIAIDDKSSTKRATWHARANDDAISSFAQDAIGRRQVVCQLAQDALRSDSPIIALQGRLGDGKTSVLNLLRTEIENKAIIVRFTAWLPGSEATFAADLFRDIILACERLVYVPQLRKHAQAFAQSIAGSANVLSGFRELIPRRSQQAEIEGLKAVLECLPRRVVVLLDELDRMEREELVVLFKVLRGAASLPNVTFVCAFSAEEVRKQLGEKGTSADYLDKFFPVTVNLPPPSTDVVKRNFVRELVVRLHDQGWIRTPEESEELTGLLGAAWDDGVGGFCTNFRRAAMLINGICGVSAQIIRELNVIDVVLIELIRQVVPSLYRTLRTSGEYLTGTHRLMEDLQSPIETKRVQDFVSGLVDPADCMSASLSGVLSWMFPVYGQLTDRTRYIVTVNARQSGHGVTPDERRICDPEYFAMYFHATLPDEMFGNVALERFLSAVASKKIEGDVLDIYKETLSSMAQGEAKRADFLEKMARSAGRFIPPKQLEWLAYAVAACASEYEYEISGYSDWRHAMRTVFVAAENSTGGTQRILEGAIRCASKDVFAARVLDSTDGIANEIIKDFSKIDKGGLANAFATRMRTLYGDGADIPVTRSNWLAVLRWAEISAAEQIEVHKAFMRYIGRDRERLVESIEFAFPQNVAFTGNPLPVVGRFLPTAEVFSLAEAIDRESPSDAVTRLKDLSSRKWRSPMN